MLLQETRGVLRGSDEFVELDECAVVLMGETGQESALKAVDRYRKAFNGDVDLRYAVVSFPQDGQEADSLLNAAYERLDLARQRGTGAVVSEMRTNQGN